MELTRPSYRRRERWIDGETSVSITHRENILRTFRDGISSWVPIIGHVDSYNRPGDEGMPPEIAEAATEHGWWSGHAGIAYARYLDITIAAWTPPPLSIEQSTCETESIESVRDTIRTIHTPSGDLREVIRKAEKGAASYRVEHLLKGPDDLARLAEVFAGEHIVLDEEQRTLIETRADDVGEGGILISPMPGTPLGMLIRIYAGPETTAYLHADAPEALGDLFSVMERNYRQRYELGAATPIDAFLGMDDTSTNTESPSMFREYCLGYTDRIADIVHRNDAMYWHHSCGLIHDLLPIYRESRMDAVHAFTEPPTGNVFLDEGRELLGDRIGIVAGLRIMEHPLADRKHAAEVVRGVFERASRGVRFGLCLTAFQHLTMEQIRWFRDESAQYQLPAGSRH